MYFWPSEFRGPYFYKGKNAAEFDTLYIVESRVAFRVALCCIIP